MIYEDEHGIRYKVRETLNSMMRGSGVPCYKVHYSSANRQQFIFGSRPYFRGAHAVQVIITGRSDAVNISK